MYDFEAKINDLIGKPYNENTYHCWNLIEELLPNAPKVSAVSKTLFANSKTFKKEIEENKLKEVTSYSNKDIILLGNGNIFFHAGVFYNGGIIHATNSGVVYEDIQKVKRTYTSIKGLRI